MVLHGPPPGTSASSETSIPNSCMTILSTANATHYSILERWGKCHDFLAERLGGKGGGEAEASTVPL